MVINQLEDIKENYQKEKLSSTTESRKIIFTCTELEEKSPKLNIANLKQIDPAIMQYSLKKCVTRYNKDDLLALKTCKLAQSPPACLYDPRIMRLNIVTHSEGYESQLKEFRGLLLPNLSLSTLDPNLLVLLNNYQKSMLPSNYNYVNNGYNDPRGESNLSFDRRVTWGGQKPVLEKSFNKFSTSNRMNFFDNAAMRPPRMGVGSLEPQKNRQHQFQSAKATSCSNEQKAYYSKNLSTGSSMNETRSSYNDSMEKSTNNSNIKEHPKGSADDIEAEPEWFSWPASRHDFVELHGFDEPLNGGASTGSTDSGGRASNQNSSGKVEFDDFVDYNRRQEINSNLASSAYRRSGYNQQNRYVRNQNFNSNVSGHDLNSGQRYRSSKSTYDHTGVKKFSYTVPNNDNNNHIQDEAVTVNPFFEMWKRKNWISAVGSVSTIADVENSIRQNEKSLMDTYPRQEPDRAAINTSTVPQFFQSLASSTPFSTSSSNVFPAMSTMPTFQQLQQHTSEIMRNAMMRRHFRDDNKFPK